MKACLILSMALLWAWCAQAQSYSITSCKISGGGGASSGGAYSVTGSIAQPEAHAASSGGTYSLSGGFFGQYMALQQTGAPPLIIRSAGANVQVVWAASVPGWILQSSTDLTPASWGDIPGNPTVSGAEQYHQFPASGGRVFYRLRKL